VLRPALATQGDPGPDRPDLNEGSGAGLSRRGRGGAPTSRGRRGSGRQRVPAAPRRCRGQRAGRSLAASGCTCARDGCRALDPGRPSFIGKRNRKPIVQNLKTRSKGPRARVRIAKRGMCTSAGRASTAPRRRPGPSAGCRAVPTVGFGRIVLSFQRIRNSDTEPLSKSGPRSIYKVNERWWKATTRPNPLRRTATTLSPGCDSAKTWPAASAQTFVAP
jgi:hypothetical protein